MLTSDLSAEVSRATAAEGVLTSNLSDEVSTRAAADTTLQSNIDAEATTRSNADSSLNSKITAEKNRIDAILLSADADKDSFVEIVSLINAVDTVNDDALAVVIGNLNAEISATNADVTSIDSRVLGVEGDLSDEVSRATAAEGVLTSNLSTEVSRATAAEGVLTSNLSAEVSSRISGDSSLATKITTDITAANNSINSRVSNEEVARASVDTVLSNALVAEASIRLAADDVLDSRIVDIISNTDPNSIDSFSEVISTLNGQDNSVVTYVDAVKPGEMEFYTADGTNKQFNSDVLYGTHMLFLNGLKQREGQDYSHSNGVYTFAQKPANGSRVEFYGVDGTVNVPSF